MVMNTSRTHTLPITLLVAALCLPCLPASGAPKARPNYFMVLQAPVLADGLHSTLGQALGKKLQTRLGKSVSLSLGERPAGKVATKRHLRKSRLSGLATVPRISCKQPKKVNGTTVVRCQVSLMLLTLRRQNLVSAYWCEAEVQSSQPTMSAADLRRMQQDVLVAAADGAADDMLSFLESNRPGTGRLPRKGY